MELLMDFELVSFQHVPREENQMADALATLVTMVQVNEGQELGIQVQRQRSLAYCHYVDTKEETPVTGP
ncbi:hypothetical protein CR513_53764, partial [Mucuna pruriens]